MTENGRVIPPEAATRLLSPRDYAKLAVEALRRGRRNPDSQSDAEKEAIGFMTAALRAKPAERLALHGLYGEIKVLDPEIADGLWFVSRQSGIIKQERTLRGILGLTDTDQPGKRVRRKGHRTFSPGYIAPPNQ